MSEGFLYDSGPIYPDETGNTFTPVVVSADSFNDVFTRKKLFFNQKLDKIFQQ